MQRIVVAIAAALLPAGCGEMRQGKPDFIAETRRITPKPKICSDYDNRQEIRADDRAGKLSRADKEFLDMDGDGRFCEERGNSPGPSA